MSVPPYETSLTDDFSRKFLMGLPVFVHSIGEHLLINAQWKDVSLRPSVDLRSKFRRPAIPCDVPECQVDEHLVSRTVLRVSHAVHVH